MTLFPGVKVRRAVEASSAAFDAGEYSRAVDLGEEAVGLARHHRRAHYEAFAGLIVCKSFLLLGDPAAAGRSLNSARQAAERDRSPAKPVLLWDLEHNQARLHDLAFHVEDALEAYERAITMLEKAASIPSVHVFGQGNQLRAYWRQSKLGIADILARTGKIAEAMHRCDEVVNSAWQDRDGSTLLAALAERSWLLRIINDNDEAARTIGVALDTIDELDFSRAHQTSLATSLSRAGLEMARLQVLAGNTAGLDEGFVQARELAERSGVADLLVEVIAAEADIALSTGRPERALEVAGEARSIATDSHLATTMSLRSYTHALAANGRLDEAHECLTDLLTLEREIGQPVSAAQMSVLAASIASRLGKTEEALSHVRQVIHGYGTISAAVGTSSARTQLFGGDADQRSLCLTISAEAATKDIPEAGITALEAAETWREDTLAATMRANHGTLPSQLHELIGQIDAVRSALTTPHSSASLPGLIDRRTHNQARLSSQLEDLRSKLAYTVGEGFASSYLPTPVSGEDILAACGDRPLLSLTPTEGENEGSISGYTVYVLPGSRPAVRKFRLSPAASDLLRVLHSGRIVRRQEEQFSFLDSWWGLRNELTDLLLPSPLRDWLTGHATELIACADGVLRNLPVTALSITERQVVADRVVVNRLPLLRLVTGEAAPAVVKGPARVLGVFEPTLEGAVDERMALRERHLAGEVHLTEVSKPAELLTALEKREFDLLILSTHGSGSGLDYRFHLPGGDLAAISLLQAHVPRAVVAASCYSGTDAGTDATGALALLLSAGARSVVTGSWGLPDKQTGQLLSKVYRTWDGRTSLSQLVNQAQRHSHLRLGAANPLSWAGLVTTWQ